MGGCCDLSTSVHHLVDKLGTELGYLMSKDTGYDVEDCISHSLLKGLSYALLDVFGATITDIHLRASSVPIHRRKA